MADSEEKKLGPNVTWNPGDEYKQPMQMYGVTFAPGKSVNVEDTVGASNAQQILKKLAGNRSFKVDGGPDHEAEAEKKAKAQEEGEKSLEEARQKAEEAKNQTPQPPPDWQGPETASLESDSGARRPSVPRGRER